MTEIAIGYVNEIQRNDQLWNVEDNSVVIDGVTCKIFGISLGSLLCLGNNGSAKESEKIVIEDF